MYGHDLADHSWSCVRLSLHAYLVAARNADFGGTRMSGILTFTATPMHLRGIPSKGVGVVIGHDLQPIGFYPFSPVVGATLQKFWGRKCRITVDGGYEIVKVEKAK